MAEGKLTIKQEKFCNKYLECGNASEAYRFAYDCSRMTDNVISVKASQLLSNGKVTVRVKQLQAQLAEKELITKEELIRLNVSIINADVLDFVDADMVDMKTEYGVRQVPSISFQDLKSLPPEKRRLPATLPKPVCSTASRPSQKDWPMRCCRSNRCSPNLPNTSQPNAKP